MSALQSEANRRRWADPAYTERVSARLSVALRRYWTRLSAAQRADRLAGAQAAGRKRWGSLGVRFWGRVQVIEDVNSCWMWEGGKNGDGYGLIRNDRQQALVHRVAWEFANGRPVPVGMVVRHKCDTRACVRPSHLELGTTAENNFDMAVRRRGRRSKAGLPFGVQRHRNRWLARICIDGQQRLLGSFAAREEAAAVAERARAERDGNATVIAGSVRVPLTGD